MKKPHSDIFNKRTLSNAVVICAGVLLYMLLSHFVQVRNTIAWLFGIISPFVVGILIAYLLNMPMRFFEARLYHRFRRKRTLSVLTTYALALFLLVLLMSMVIPQLVESISGLFSNLSAYLNNFNVLLQQIGARFDIDPDTINYFMVNYNDLVNQVMVFVREFLPNLLNYTMQIGSGLVTFLTAVIASVYMLSGKDKLLRQTRRVLYALFPHKTADSIMRVAGLSNQVFSGFISGKLLDSAIIGLICFVFMNLMNFFAMVFGADSLRMPFALLISVIIGITNIIPFFGPFIGAIPSCMILLMVNPWSSLWFVIFIIVLQQFDGNILGPKILGNSTGLPAMWVLVSIIVGQGLFGFTGMLLGIPTAAVFYTLSSDFIAARLRRKGLDKQEDLTYAVAVAKDAGNTENEEEHADG